MAPPWVSAIGRAKAAGAVLVDHVTGDGVNVMIGYDDPVEPHSLGIYVDHSLGGMAKDILVGPPLPQARAFFGEGEGFSVTALELAEARARLEAALAQTDRTLGAPVAEDFDQYRPFLERRVRALPRGGVAPDRPGACCTHPVPS
ncbi:MAG: hypothetical protein HYX34_15735 [Actinobacteria bacterium]|nr:hypothetical protein [Actinomycetota bacterium]